MAVSQQVPVEIRQDAGKGASRRLRRAGKVPAILYGGDSEPVALQLEHDFIQHAIEDEHFTTSVLEMKVGKKREKVVLRDVQRHPFKPTVQHVDFQRISEKEALRMTVPLHFVGEEESTAGKAANIVISHQLTSVEVSCLPNDLPDYLEVDLSSAEVGDIIHLSDLQLPAGVELTALQHGTEGDETVVSVQYAAAAGGGEGAGEEGEGEEGAEGEGEG